MASMNHGIMVRRRPHDPALDVRQLRAFVALIDHGSMTGAAQAIGLAQSTVSESLAALERVLGTRVVLRRRGSHEVALTAAGEALLPHARGVLTALGDAHAAVASAACDAHATVEIIANESVSTYLLPQALAPIRERWPNVRFAVSVATCDGVRAGVADGTFDMGLLLESDVATVSARPAPPDSAESAESSQPDRIDRAHVGPDDRTVVATDVPLVIFANPTHPLLSARARNAIRCDDLALYPLFISDAAGEFHTLLREFFDAGGAPGQVLEAAGSIEGVKRWVASDSRALGILPAYAVAAELRDGRVAPVALRTATPRMVLTVLLSESRSHHPSLDALIDSVRTEAAAHPA